MYNLKSYNRIENILQNSKNVRAMDLKQKYKVIFDLRVWVYKIILQYFNNKKAAPTRAALPFFSKPQKNNTFDTPLHPYIFHKKKGCFSIQHINTFT